MRLKTQEKKVRSMSESNFVGQIKSNIQELKMSMQHIEKMIEKSKLLLSFPTAN